ncbi:hypothetical protein, partial [Methylicorpusculum sp.]|uniref:hypothetical protein n=1 Tax=Methylicorpusculum sp. TaxID=2713644 RepID=UPI002ABA147A
MFNLHGHRAFLSLAALLSIAPTSHFAMNYHFEEKEQEERQASSSTDHRRDQEEELSDNTSSDQNAAESDLESEQVWPQRTHHSTRQPKRVTRSNSETDLNIFQQLSDTTVRGQTIHVHGQNITYNTYNNTYNFSRTTGAPNTSAQPNTNQATTQQPPTQQQSEIEREGQDRLAFARTEKVLSPDLVASLLKTCPRTLAMATKQFKH